MIGILSTLLLASLPYVSSLGVSSLDQAGFAEAQQRDDTATRAFSATEIQTSDGRCLFIDELSGDSRANLTPIQVAACNGSTGQLWDVITKGKHVDPSKSGLMILVNTLVCLLIPKIQIKCAKIFRRKLA